MTIGNVGVSLVLIVADIVDEVNIAADFMIVHGIHLNRGQQIMSWGNVEIPHDIGFKHPVHVKRVVAVEQQVNHLYPLSESFIWAHIEGDCKENRL